MSPINDDPEEYEDADSTPAPVTRPVRPMRTVTSSANADETDYEDDLSDTAEFPPVAPTPEPVPVGPTPVGPTPAPAMSSTYNDYSDYSGGNYSGSSRGKSKKPRKRRRHHRVARVIVTVIIIALLVCAGVIIYARKHEEALSACRDSVDRFSAARRQVLSTTSDTSTFQRIIRQALGVDEAISDFARAAEQAEDTVRVEACSTNATITQLTLVKDTLDSATESLINALSGANAGGSGAETTATPEPSQTPEPTPVETETAEPAEPEEPTEPTETEEPDISTPSQEPDTDPSVTDDSTATSDDDAVEEARKQLESTLQEAQELLDTVRNDPTVNAAGKLLVEGVQRAVDAGQKAIDESGVKDSRYYKAAQSTLREAIDALNTWIDSQAAKADE